MRQVADEFRRRGDDGHAGAVIDRAGPLVPAVEVRAEQHDFLRTLAAAHLGDHVLRMRVPYIGGAREQPHAHAEPQCGDALDLIGIGAAEREGRHRHPAVHVARGARVRQAMAVGAHRAQQERDRSAPRSLRRPVGADRHRGAVTLAVLGPHHALRHERDPAAERAGRSGLEILQRREDRYLSLQPAGRGRRRLAERRNHQRLRGRADQLRALGAAHPGGEREGLDVHILEAERLQPRRRPLGGLLLVDRTRRARAEAGGELAHPRIGDGVSGHRGIAQLRRDGFRRRRRGGWHAAQRTAAARRRRLTYAADGGGNAK